MKKISTAIAKASKKISQQRLTVGLDWAIGWRAHLFPGGSTTTEVAPPFEFFKEWEPRTPAPWDVLSFITFNSGFLTSSSACSESRCVVPTLRKTAKDGAADLFVAKGWASPPLNPVTRRGRR